MYTREEASRLRLAFWTTFGQYLSPYQSAEGNKVNWSNYKTGLKHVAFRMQADQKSASIAIELSHPDSDIQELFFEQFKELRNLFDQALDETWTWELHGADEQGKTKSRIYKEISPVNIFNKEDWPALISFFKPRILALDAFWTDAQYAFEPLK